MDVVTKDTLICIINYLLKSSAIIYETKQSTLNSVFMKNIYIFSFLTFHHIETSENLGWLSSNFLP